MSKRIMDLTKPIIDLTEEPIPNRRVHNFERLLGRSIPLRRLMNKRRRRHLGPRVADIGQLVDKISEFLPHTTSCGPQQQCLRKPRGAHIVNTGRNCLLNRVLPKPPYGSELACWYSGWKEYIKSTRFHNKAKRLKIVPDTTVSKVAEDIMNDYHAVMKAQYGSRVGALTTNFREEVVLALIPNYEQTIYSNLELNASWFYNPKFLARVADVLITKAKSVRGDSYDIRTATHNLVNLAYVHLQGKHSKDNDYVKTYFSFVNSIISGIPNIDTPHRERLLKSFMERGFTFK